MSESFVVPPHTREAQRRASEPTAFAWVSANAGAGKTKVLSDRVIRLLLKGTPPGRILCLTFTKAAAANMAIRVFERLGRWVTLEDAILSEELFELEGAMPGPQHMQAARRLFAQAVETPGGLKIETIHAFCERLLHLAPFEANVPARFTVLDDNASQELIQDSLAKVLADAASGSQPELAAALAVVSLEATGDRLLEALHAALRHRIEKPDLALAKGLDSLRKSLFLAPEETSAFFTASILANGFARELWPDFIATLRSGQKTDQARADALLAALNADDDESCTFHYLSIFLKPDQEGRKGSAFLTKAVPEPLKEQFLVEQQRVLHLLDRRRAAEGLERTRALFVLAEAMAKRVREEKTRRGALDFSDLIDKTLALVTGGDAAWMLYKLDRGVDHVLLDEAQDTNPAQWEIVRALTEDFTAGSGARAGKVRTVFAVGDPKQSIYGFQGAVPQEFEQNRRHWSRKVADAELIFDDVRLTVSFRSAKAILSAVDATFKIPLHFQGLSFDDGAVGTVHESARPDAAGVVELWPVEQPEEKADPDAWSQPLDEAETSSPAVRAARRVAQAVKILTTQGDETGRVWRAGDILILVRKRNAAFEAVIRALKEFDVAVAGADRLDIGEHIAVLDLIAAGRAALLPQDDLTLATALKSPLVGFDDDDLIRIATSRAENEPFVSALQRLAAKGEPKATQGLQALKGWRRLAREGSPFKFFVNLLGPQGGRSQLIARLGSEAGDAIDAFLSLAYRSERETPSLMSFLYRFESASHALRRDLDSSRDEARVMTVHGAKGLEAPVVFVLDGGDIVGSNSPLLALSAPSESLPVWCASKRLDCETISLAREALRQRGLEEHNRLLYVAMTRAKDRLVIAPYLTDARQSPEGLAWHAMIRTGFAAQGLDLAKVTLPYGSVDLWREGIFSPNPSNLPADRLVYPVPEWLTQPILPEPETTWLNPSRAFAGLKSRDDASLREKRLRGTLIHRLIERLADRPVQQRREAARIIVETQGRDFSAEAQGSIIEEALGVLAHPDLAPLFGQGSRAEVPLCGRLSQHGQVTVMGRIDRLAVLQDEVLLGEFKTTPVVPSPGSDLFSAQGVQLALYTTLLRELYPLARIRAFMIWTSGPRIREFSQRDIEEILRRMKHGASSQPQETLIHLSAEPKFNA